MRIENCAATGQYRQIARLAAVSRLSHEALELSPGDKPLVSR